MSDMKMGDKLQIKNDLFLELKGQNFNLTLKPNLCWVLVMNSIKAEMPIEMITNTDKCYQMWSFMSTCISISTKKIEWIKPTVDICNKVFIFQNHNKCHTFDAGSYVKVVNPDALSTVMWIKLNGNSHDTNREDNSGIYGTIYTRYLSKQKYTVLI